VTKDSQSIDILTIWIHPYISRLAKMALAGTARVQLQMKFILLPSRLHVTLS